MPTALSWDLEWYAVAPPVSHHTPTATSRPAWCTGVVELPDGAGFELREVPAHRWHRWGAALGAGAAARRRAPTRAARAVFGFPDGTVADWVLTPDGWRARRPL